MMISEMPDLSKEYHSFPRILANQYLRPAGPAEGKTQASVCSRRHSLHSLAGEQGRWNDGAFAAGLQPVRERIGA